MDDKFLKTRVSPGLYEQLLAKAGSDGKRLGTFVRDVLERDLQAVTTAEALARIEAAVSAASAQAAPAPAAVLDHEIVRQIAEIRLLLRELCMQTNAQIVGRVVAQLNAQAPSAACSWHARRSPCTCCSRAPPAPARPRPWPS